MQAAATMHASSQDQTITSLDTQHATDAAEINHLKMQLETATNTLHLLTKEFQMFKNQTLKNTEETQVKQRNDAALHANLLEEKAVLMVEMGKLGKQISDLENEYSTVKTASAAQEVAVAGLQREVMLEKQRVWDITAAKDKESQQRTVQIKAQQQQIQEQLQELASLAGEKKQLSDEVSKVRYDTSVVATKHNDEMSVLLSKQQALENQVVSLTSHLKNVKTSDATLAAKITDLQSQLIEKTSQLAAAELASSQTATAVEKAKQQALLAAQKVKSEDDKTIATMNTQHVADTAEINHLKSQLEGDSMITPPPRFPPPIPSPSPFSLPPPSVFVLRCYVCTLHCVAVSYESHHLRCFVTNASSPSPLPCL